MEGIPVKISSFRKDGSLKSKNRAFSHLEVLGITNHFETVIGEGGFGKVYLGTLEDDTQVAVKLLSKSSQQGFKEFHSEAELLMVVHHRNLVSLVGYCDDGDTKALLYEYMIEGNLRQKLSDKNPCALKWKERLQIALDAACGLDYLHNGCKPAIIHRDLKTSNILLSMHMQAKIADFGLSRAFDNDTDTHISTRPAGTYGYLDPEFHRSGSLNKKSDVYSFGIILLELMTGQRAITETSDGARHISDWVNPKLETGDIQAIVDPRLEGKFSRASAWKFLEIAMSCITPAAVQRPDIKHVVADLKECLALEISLQNAESNSGTSGSPLITAYFPLESNSGPCARKSTPLWVLALNAFVSLLIAVAAADAGNSEGISIDCGVTRPSCDENGFCYEADDGSVVESGQIYNVSSEHTLTSEDEQLWQEMNTLRSFPEGKRNCYTLKAKHGIYNYYLVRAYFLYGNYDSKNSVPRFESHLGVNSWETLGEDPNVVRTEVIHVSQANNIDVCLIKTGFGIPFVSLLEIWPLHNKAVYRTTSNLLPLRLVTRSALGKSTTNSDFIRYPDDIYGRSWWLDRKIQNSKPISTSVAIDADNSDYRLPKEVLRTAILTRNDSSSLVIDHLNCSTDHEYYVYLHFFDFEERSLDQEREMEITFTDTIPPENITLQHRVLKTVIRPIPRGEYLNTISITSTPDSLPPMLNALEIYQNERRCMLGDSTCETSVLDDIYMNRNLSSSNLTGEINTSFSDLMSLESLDLSNNHLMGEIPEIFSKLPNLKLLSNLSGNNLTGSIPKALREKNGTPLILSLDGNPSLCQIGACKTKTQKAVIPIIASVVASVAVLVMVIGIYVKLCKHKRKKQRDMEGIPATSFQNDGNLKSKNRAFNHLEVLSITNSFENVIGEGGFGKVYLGTLQDGTKVAVKLLSKSSQQGFKEFQSEAELLMVVHHRNLVSLVGYCNDGETKALVYEYMSEGNLRQKLSDTNPCALKWNERLQIALDAACGLDYLHNGCKPAIIHRDLKPSNILLGKNMQAKIADFGLSRAFFDDTNAQYSTCPAGTIGYLDPEFHSCGNLNKKSDVYSFGIILLELMSGRPAVIRAPGSTSHISDWVAPKLESGDIQSITDPRLEGQFNTASAWKFLEIAMSCIPQVAIKRPDIGHVVADLKDCLALEMSLQNAESNSGTSGSSLSTTYLALELNSGPCAR
ncbi:probable LRR receptor-like serine/threonine-protein kinase At1g51880 [Neltuma alba]|uniref:probable LRR receptor-like serine/threonine-protein kinase At1g51880 n=1 Tax=Neltuma alba TaxID=207710 RepID=UPI0010A4EB36|nr:probable LRR receptor-like serine/threonine-protein kinase At1g51880 [Prosopis alba]